MDKKTLKKRNKKKGFKKSKSKSKFIFRLYKNRFIRFRY